MLFILSGCQHQLAQLRNRDKDYLHSVVIAPLRVPEGLSTPEKYDDFPLPQHIPLPGSVAAVSIVPPGFGVLENEEKEGGAHEDTNFIVYG